jgi:hypothetical protein
MCCRRTSYSALRYDPPPDARCQYVTFTPFQIYLFCDKVSLRADRYRRQALDGARRSRRVARQEQHRAKSPKVQQATSNLIATGRSTNPPELPDTSYAVQPPELPFCLRNCRYASPADLKTSLPFRRVNKEADDRVISRPPFQLRPNLNRALELS